jgi:hypothetical protein
VNAGIEGGLFEQFLKISYVLDLTRLGDSVSFGSKPPFCIKFHDIFRLLENSQIKKEAADDGTGSPLAVITVKDCDSFGVCHQKL